MLLDQLRASAGTAPERLWTPSLINVAAAVAVAAVHLTWHCLLVVLRVLQQAAAANTMAVQEGMNGDAQAMYGNCMVMPGAYGQGMPAGMPPNGYGAAYGQQYAPFPHQQYQPDMSGSYFQGQPHPM